MNSAFIPAARKMSKKEEEQEKGEEEQEGEYCKRPLFVSGRSDPK